MWDKVVDVAIGVAFGNGKTAVVTVAKLGEKQVFTTA